MAVPALIAQGARAAGSALADPAVRAKAADLLRRATGGRLTAASTPEDVTKFAASNPGRFAVVAETMVKAGVAPSTMVSDDMVGSAAEMRMLREQLDKVAAGLRQRFDAGSASPYSPAMADITKAALAMRQVRAVLDVYGTRERYFLCHPNGGVPAESFVLYETMKRSGA